MIGLIDFDCTCVYSQPGAYSLEDTGAARVLKRLVEKGHDLVLWTCRNESPDNQYNYLSTGEPRKENSLQEAVRWFEEHEIPLYGINEVPGCEEVIGTSKKPLADFTIDDTNIGIPLKYEFVECTLYGNGEKAMYWCKCVDWDKVEKILEENEIL